MMNSCAIRDVGGRAQTMAIETIDGLWVCVDCAMYIANGEMPADADRAREREIEAGMEQEGYEWTLGTDVETECFSWRRCDCCGSGLGGERHSATLFKAFRE